MKPILFNTDMVRAILEGRKTVTRRVIKFTVQDVYGAACFRGLWYETLNPACPPEHLKEWYVKEVCRPRYQPGDILYVRETWGDYRECEPGGAWYYMYRADYPDGATTTTHPDGTVFDLPIWRPSIHMPREAARLFLRVTGVRVERLQDIDGAESEAEGALVVLNPVIRYDKAIYAKFGKIEFKQIWDSTIKRSDRELYGWAADPWVWVIKFERITKEEAVKGAG